MRRQTWIYKSDFNDTPLSSQVVIGSSSMLWLHALTSLFSDHAALTAVASCNYMGTQDSSVQHRFNSHLFDEYVISSILLRCVLQIDLVADLIIWQPMNSVVDGLLFV